jgi:hypothetical protein
MSITNQAPRNVPQNVLIWVEFFSTKHDVCMQNFVAMIKNSILEAQH